MAETVTTKQLLEAGAHFGHQTSRWNPKMAPYIFGVRGGVHILDLGQTAQHLQQAADFARHTAEDGGRVLFVGTKRQTKTIIKDEAEKAGMPYVSERWLGGMLTNFRTIRQRVSHLGTLETNLESGKYEERFNKKEVLDLTNEAAALKRIFGGIQQMPELPAAVFVADAVNEDIAIAEARKLNIPVIAIVDTNVNPSLIDYAIPANDDAIKSVRLITHAIAQAAAEGAATYAATKQDEVVEETKNEEVAA